ncbi:hypothetical protein COLO4_25092 [Corchorus olitorius]|uniref:Uncharacterized protein n=1 Tax=Corchorus olitorius TaxID=93759 RepID=A0A1R3I4Q7_9ROSI|nr:hypothetical protein COLO4_25092 [Corchorus olitorius]
MGLMSCAESVRGMGAELTLMIQQVSSNSTLAAEWGLCLQLMNPSLN